MIKIQVQTYKPVGALEDHAAEQEGPFLMVNGNAYITGETVTTELQVEPTDIPALAGELASRVNAKVYTFAFFRREMVPSLRS
jgi:hypothetical protein